MDAEVVAYLLLQKMQNLLQDEEISMTPKLKNQVQKTTHQLNLFRQLMKNADKNLLCALYSMDDSVDTFLIRKARQSQIRQNGFKMICQQPFNSFCNHFVFSKKIKEFISKIEDLVKDKQMDVQGVVDDNNMQGARQYQRWGRISRFCFDDQSHMVGLEEQVNNLVALVLQGAEQEKPPEVVSIVGEGGSGKTAIARTTYNRLDIKRRFSSCAWVHVTEDYNLRDVLVDMISQLDEKIAKEPLLVEEVKWRLPKLLEQRRYLIVVDDVNTTKLWEDIKEVFPSSSSHGGVVLLTTRKVDVAVHAGSSSTLQLRPLNNEESWALFLKKLEVTEDRLHNSDLLINFKEKILRLCGGLTLAIVLFGGLLSCKELTDSEWSRAIENVNVVGDILALSYHELPSYLKPCFLYMALFPKAMEIPIRRLIHLWIAEGFVKNSTNGDMVEEDLAEMYFEELVCRKMVEVVRWRLDGSPKACCLPSVLYDVYSSKARDIGFFQIHSKTFSAKKSELPVRRLAVYSNTPCSKLHISHLHSYVSFNSLKGGISIGNSSVTLDKIIRKENIGVLRVLDLENVHKPQLPKAIGILLNLRYLNLRSTAIVIDSLPVSFGLLQCLETLDVKHTNITTLPDSFWKLENLRHLYLNGILLDSLEALSMMSLNKLQSLCGLSIRTQSLVAETFSKLTCLRKLKLTFYTPRSINIDWTLQLNKLHTLRIRSLRESGERGSIKCRNFKEQYNLVHLYLFGALLPPLSSRNLPPNLKSLTLSKTGMDRDPMPMLGKLPHLNILRLLNFSYTGEEMNCDSGAFPQLHVLKLWQLDFCQWIVKEGALASLKELEIRDCRRLKTLDAFTQLTGLRELILTNMATEFADYVKGINNNTGRDVFIREYRWEPSPPTW